MATDTFLKGRMLASPGLGLQTGEERKELVQNFSKETKVCDGVKRVGTGQDTRKGKKFVHNFQATVISYLKLCARAQNLPFFISEIITLISCHSSFMLHKTRFFGIRAASS
jgi:hypothetical protein